MLYKRVKSEIGKVSLIGEPALMRLPHALFVPDLEAITTGAHLIDMVREGELVRLIVKT